jgi:hypothetical protein
VIIEEVVLHPVFVGAKAWPCRHVVDALRVADEPIFRIGTVSNKLAEEQLHAREAEGLLAVDPHLQIKIALEN